MHGLVDKIARHLGDKAGPITPIGDNAKYGWHIDCNGPDGHSATVQAIDAEQVVWQIMKNDGSDEVLSRKVEIVETGDDAEQLAKYIADYLTA